MRYSNLHTHTVFSDGKSTMEENVLSAIEKNMSALGFSEHSYTDFDESYCMKKDAMPAYLAEIQRVKEKYSGQIEVYTGLELDGGSVLEDRTPFDYIIGACHYVMTPVGYISVDHAKDLQKDTLDRYFGGDPVAYSKAYFENYTRRQYEMRPDILAHMDLNTKYGFMDEEDKRYKRLALDCLTDCLEVCGIVELNTGAIARGLRTVPYPSATLLRETLARGGRVILSSDSHHRDNLTFWFDEAVELLRSLGFKSIVQFVRGGFTEVGI